MVLTELINKQIEKQASGIVEKEKIDQIREEFENRIVGVLKACSDLKSFYAILSGLTLNYESFECLSEEERKQWGIAIHVLFNDHAEKISNAVWEADDILIE